MKRPTPHAAPQSKRRNSLREIAPKPQISTNNLRRASSSIRSAAAISSLATPSGGLWTPGANTGGMLGTPWSASLLDFAGLSVHSPMVPAARSPRPTPNVLPSTLQVQEVQPPQSSSVNMPFPPQLDILTAFHDNSNVNDTRSANLVPPQLLLTPAAPNESDEDVLTPIRLEDTFQSARASMIASAPPSPMPQSNDLFGAFSFDSSLFDDGISYLQDPVSSSTDTTANILESMFPGESTESLGSSISSLPAIQEHELQPADEWLSSLLVADPSLGEFGSISLDTLLTASEPPSSRVSPMPGTLSVSHPASPQFLSPASSGNLSATAPYAFVSSPLSTFLPLTGSFSALTSPHTPTLESMAFQDGRARSLSASSAMAHSVSPLLGPSELPREELFHIFQVAGNYGSLTRSKRDLAVICLLFDPHLSCGLVSKLTLASVPTVVTALAMGMSEEMFVQTLVQKSEHYVVPQETQYTSMGSRGQLVVHPFTAWALFCWIQELQTVYGWSLDDLHAPLFVNVNPVYEESSSNSAAAGAMPEVRPRLRQVGLKRDAICKILTSVKQRSGRAFSRQTVANTHFREMDSVFMEWIGYLQQAQARAYPIRS